MNGHHHIGIDFGSRLAGTTAVCYESNGQLEILQSQKNQDADTFITELLKTMGPKHVFIDAPLSLPGAYSGQSDDFFYRNADRVLKAMSPMFLGGLTARAMKLKSRFPDILFMETYPRQLVRLLTLHETYRKDNHLFLEQMRLLLPFNLPRKKPNWHATDAVLAWYSGWRYLNQQFEIYGNKEEGFIYA